MAEEVLLAFSTFADADTARKAARTLVEEQLAACANLVPQIESIYSWKGNIESSPEVLVIFKTTHGRYQQFEQRLRALHPYEVPEIVAIQVRDGLSDYLSWVVESCGRAPRRIDRQRPGVHNAGMYLWELIADRMSRAGWTCKCAPYFEGGRRVYCAAAHRDDGNRFVVHADERHVAFEELERMIRESATSTRDNAADPH